MIQDQEPLQKDGGENLHSKVNVWGIKEYNLMLGEVSGTAWRAYFVS